MVKNSGKTLRADTYRPVNAPEPIEVEEDPSAYPQAIKTPQRQAVVTIDNRWRIDDEWWRCEPVSRLYYEILLASGQRLVLCKDIANDCWYRQSY
jgi:hypothetical protein